MLPERTYSVGASIQYMGRNRVFTSSWLDPMINTNLFGRFRVEQTNGIDITPRSQKACAIRAYLALAPKGTASRDKLMGLLWGNSPEEQARASLRQSLHVLRHCVNGVGPEFISAGRQSVRLDLTQVRVDAM